MQSVVVNSISLDPNFERQIHIKTSRSCLISQSIVVCTTNGTHDQLIIAQGLLRFNLSYESNLHSSFITVVNSIDLICSLRLIS